MENVTHTKWCISGALPSFQIIQCHPYCTSQKEICNSVLVNNINDGRILRHLQYNCNSMYKLCWFHPRWCHLTTVCNCAFFTSLNSTDTGYLFPADSIGLALFTFKQQAPGLHTFLSLTTFNETLIFDGKCHRCNNTVTDVQFTLQLPKNI